MFCTENKGDVDDFSWKCSIFSNHVQGGFCNVENMQFKDFNLVTFEDLFCFHWNKIRHSEQSFKMDSKFTVKPIIMLQWSY